MACAFRLAPSARCHRCFGRADRPFAVRQNTPHRPHLDRTDERYCRWWQGFGGRQVLRRCHKETPRRMVPAVRSPSSRLGSEVPACRLVGVWRPELGREFRRRVPPAPRLRPYTLSASALRLYGRVAGEERTGAPRCPPDYQRPRQRQVFCYRFGRCPRPRYARFAREYSPNLPRRRYRALPAFRHSDGRVLAPLTDAR